MELVLVETHKRSAVQMNLLTFVVSRALCVHLITSKAIFSLTTSSRPNTLVSISDLLEMVKVCFHTVF